MKTISRITTIAVFCLPYLLCSPAYDEFKVDYQNHNGQKITAMYHNPSDEKAIFSVTLKFIQGDSITLNQGMAASGVRYTDNKTLVWWTKGGEALLMERDGKGDWKIINTYKEMTDEQNH